MDTMIKFLFFAVVGMVLFCVFSWVHMQNVPLSEITSPILHSAGLKNLVLLLLPFVLSYWILKSENPHKKNTQEYESLKLCRIGLVFSIWSYCCGLIGFGLALVGFILGIIGVVKGRISYGVIVILCSIFLPFANFFRPLL